MSFLRLHLLPFSVLSVLPIVTAQSIAAGIFLNSSSSTTLSSHTLSGCDQCTVTAFEAFHKYPHRVEVESITATNVVVPMVTVHPDGRLETNYITETQKQDPTAPTDSGPQNPTDPFAGLTWKPYPDITLTYPTTYVEFFDLSGGTFYPVASVVEPTGTCTFDDQPLQLPQNSATALLIPVPAGEVVDTLFPISVPATIHSYLNALPSVSSQFGGTDVASCRWTKIIGGRTTATQGISATVAPVEKVSVSVLTEVTARQVIITATGNIVTPTPGIVQTENRDTILVQPPGNTPPANNQQSPQNQQQGGGSQTTQGVGGIIAGLFDPNLNTNGGNGGSGGVTAQAVPTGGATGVAAGGAAGGGAQPSGVVTGNVQSNGQSGQANGQGGSSGGLPAPLVVVIGGTQTTISPTVISNPDTTGSVTGFVLGPGSTLLVGGSPITVSGTAISAPAATSSGGIGGAIATGLGYSGPSAADSIASSIRGPNMPLWAFAAIAGVFGVLAVGL